MRLNADGIKDIKWRENGYSMPEFDRERVVQKTKENPFWVHFGAGNIFRAFQASVVQDLLNAGVLDRGLIAVEGFDYEIIEKINRPHDDLSVAVVFKSDGIIQKQVIGSVAESLTADSENETDLRRLKEIFRNGSLQIASFTITEKGYALTDPKGHTLSAVKEDFKNGPEKPKSYMGKVAAALYERYVSGQKPLAMVSMDNCSHNGDRLKTAIAAFAKEWTVSGLVDPLFLEYVANGDRVSFPWTMIDKITPRPDPSVLEILKNDGAEDMDPVITSKNTYTAPFVNSEEFGCLVIEDSFPNGRPELEKSGFIFTDRETVDKSEKMKVCTCLNPLHTALSIFGCLLGYTLISDEMKDPALKKLVEGIGRIEGLPVVADPGIIDPNEFLDAVINVRLPNPFMPDTPQRIATDTSQKLAVRFGETIKAYLRMDGAKVKRLKFIPLVFAGWLRYLTGIDDHGNEFSLSPDPMLGALCPIVKSVKPGDIERTKQILKPILSNAALWGVDLIEIGVSDTVCGYFESMLSGPGAAYSTLTEAVSD